MKSPIYRFDTRQQRACFVKQKAKTLALVVMLTGMLTFVGCSGKSKAESRNANNNNNNATAEAARPVEVEVTQATARQIPISLQATGTIAADESSDIAPQVSGQVIATFVDVGDFVRQGQEIVRLDDRDARLRLAQAQAALTQSQSNVRQAQARLGVASGNGFNPASTPEVQAAQAALSSAETSARLAETNARRYANLVETGDVPRSTYDQFRTQAENARAQANSARQQLLSAQNAVRGSNEGINTAQAAVESARSQVGLAQKALSDTIVRAPFAGYISERATARGEYVTPASRLAVIVRTNPVKLILQIPEADAGRIQTGASVTANVSAYADRQFAGRVRAVNPSLDQAARALSVEVEVDNPNNLLRPGMFATARVSQPGGMEGVFVPRTAVTTNQNTNSSSLYVLEDGGEGIGEIARLRVVQIGDVENDQIRIVSGVRAGETVINGNTGELFDGAQIRRRQR